MQTIFRSFFVATSIILMITGNALIGNSQSDGWAAATGWSFHIGAASEWNPDYLDEVALTKDGYLFVGHHDPSDDGWVVKTKPDGSIMWQKSIGAPASTDSMYCADSTFDGGFILGGGSVLAGEEMEDGWIVKLRSNGNVAWSKRYVGPWLETINRIFETNDGKYVSYGYAFNYHDSDSDGQNPWLQKLDKSGKIVWQKLYIGGEAYDGSEMTAIETADGGYLLVGSTRTYSTADAVAIKVDASGNIIWQKLYAGKKNDQIDAAVLTEDGGFLLVGETNSFGATNDAWAVKIDADGNITWQYRYKGANTVLLKSVVAGIDGGYVIAGSTLKAEHLVLTKIDDNGKLVWAKDYAYPLSGISDYNKIDMMPVNAGYVLTGSAHGWGSPWAAFCDLAGLIGTCSPVNLKLTSTKTSAKASTATYEAVDSSFQASSVVKDKPTATTEAQNRNCY